MRVLSVQQPFAQLIVRGVKRVEVRSWDTDFRGRIAIHASAAVPSFDLEREWHADRAISRCFADQGWLDRDDLKTLPRSAIVGTVELKGTEPAEWDYWSRRSPERQFSWDVMTDLWGPVDRDPRTGETRRVEPPQPVLPVQFTMTDFLWVLRHPIEIEPVEQVRGKLNLWNLSEELSARVADGERRTARGEWAAPPVNQELRATSFKRWRDRWVAGLEAEVREIEKIVARKREARSLEFTARVEQRFQETLARYVAENGVVRSFGGDMVRLDRRLRAVFNGRDMVPQIELEWELRRHIKREVEREQQLALEKRRRKQLMRLLVDLRENPHEGLDDDDLKAKVEEELERRLDKVDRWEDEEEPSS